MNTMSGRNTYAKETKLIDISEQYLIGNLNPDITRYALNISISHQSSHSSNLSQSINTRVSHLHT
jgi:hypothetical protein